MALTLLARLGKAGAFALWTVFAVVVLGMFSGAYAYYEARPPGTDGEAESPGTVLTWRGIGDGWTEVFRLEDGEWEYCPAVEDATASDETRPRESLIDPGLRVSAYSPDGAWLTSASGAGSTGNLRCGPLQGPGEYELRITTAIGWDIDWTIRVQRAGGPPPITALPQWSIDYAEHQAPQVGDDGSLHFEGLGSMFTAFFRPAGDTWTMCWELYPTPPTPNVVSSSAYFEVQLKIEEEVGDFGQWEDPSGEASSDCVEVPTTQPAGRHWLYIQEGSHERGWRLTIGGVELVDSRPGAGIPPSSRISE